MQWLSQESISAWKRILKLAFVILVGILAAVWLRGLLREGLILVSGAAVVAFLLEPLARVYERKLSRSLAALCALATVAIALAAVLWLLLPSLIRELIELVQQLPASVQTVQDFATRATQWMEMKLPGIRLPTPDLDPSMLPSLASGTLNLASGVADVSYRLSLMIVLGYFFLCDRAKLMIRLELLIPQSLRPTAVRMGNAVCRELRLYLRGQGLIALSVGILSALGLMLIGVRSALALGGIVGLFNMIPYFGPLLGGAPAVLMALSSGWQTALLTVGVLWLVQQIDSMLLSPRILGSLTGLSPAAVLIAIFLGSHAAGIVGMLLALPLLMTFRTLYRVFVQRHENV